MIWKQLSLSMNPLDFRLRSRQWMRRQGKGRRPYGWGDAYGRITKGLRGERRPYSWGMLRLRHAKMSRQREWGADLC